MSNNSNFKTTYGKLHELDLSIKTHSIYQCVLNIRSFERGALIRAIFSLRGRTVISFVMTENNAMVIGHFLFTNIMDTSTGILHKEMPVDLCLASDLSWKEPLYFFTGLVLKIAQGQFVPAEVAKEKDKFLFPFLIDNLIKGTSLSTTE